MRCALFGQYLLEFVANVDNLIAGVNQVQNAFNGVTNQIKQLSQGLDTQLTNRIQAATQRMQELRQALRTGDLNNTVFAAARNAAREAQTEITQLTRHIAQARALMGRMAPGSAEQWTLSTQIATASQQLANFQTRLRDLQQVRTFEHIQQQIINTGRELRRVQDQIRLGAAGPRPAGVTAAQQIANLRAEEARIMALMNTMRTRQQTLAGDPAVHRAVQEMLSRDSQLVHQLTNELKANKEATQAVEKASKSTWENSQAQLRAYLQGLITTGSLLAQVGGSLQRLGVAAAAAGTLFVVMGKDIIDIGAAYQQSMDTARSVISGINDGTQKANDLFAQLERTVLRLAAITKFTASEVAEGAKFLGQAGLSVQETMAALPAVLNLSMAGFVDLGRSAEIAADFMNAFQLQGAEVSRVVDVLAKGEVVANTTLLQLANAFSFAAPVAAAMGQSIEDTAAALSLLSNSGIKASRAGTGLAQILSGLVRNVEKTTELMERYGSTFEAVDPQVRSIIDIILEFKSVGVSAADVMEQFGERAGRAMLALMNAPVSKILEIRDALHDSFGEGLRQAAIRWQNLAGAIVEFKSRVESIKIAIFKKIEDDLKNVIIRLTDLLDNVLALLNDPAWNNIAKSIIYVTTVVSGLLIVLGTLTAILGTLIAFIGGAVTQWSSLALSAQAAQAQLTAAAGAAERDAVAVLQMAAAQGLAADAVAALNAQLAGEIGLLNGAAAAAEAQQVALAAQPGLWGSIVRGLEEVGNILLRGLGYLSRWFVVIAALTVAVYGFIQAWEPVDGVFERLGSGAHFVQVLAQIISDAWQQTKSFSQTLKEFGQDFVNFFTFSGSLGDELDLIVGALFDTNEAVLILETAWRELLVELEQFIVVMGPPLLQILRYVAQLVGGIVVVALNALILTVSAVIKAVELLSFIFRQLTAVVVYFVTLITTFDTAKASKAFDEISNAADKAGNAIDKVNKQLEKSGENITKFSEKNNALINTQLGAAKELNELMGLLERQQQGNLTQPRDLERLANLKEKFGETPEQISGSIDSTIANLQALLQALENTSANTEKEKQNRIIALEILQKTLDTLVSENRETDTLKKKVDELVRSKKELTNAEADRQQRDSILEQRKAVEELQIAEEKRGDEIKKGEKLYDRILESRLVGWQKELDTIKDLTEEWAKYYQVQQDASKKDIETKKGAIEQSKRTLSDLEKLTDKNIKTTQDNLNKVIAGANDPSNGLTAEGREKVIAQAREDAIRRIQSFQQTLNNEKELQNRLEESIKNQLEEQNKLTEKNVQVNKELDLRKQEIMEKEVKARNEFLRDQQVRAAKARGDDLTATKLNAERTLEEEKDKIDKLFTLKDTANMQLKAQAIKAAIETRDATIREAEREVAEKQQKAADKAAKQAKDDEEKRMKDSLGKLKEAANPILTVHEEAAHALAKQVKSVQDLIALYNIMYKIRMDQERRAFVFSLAAAKEQRLAAQAAMRASQQPNNQALSLNAMKAQQRASIFTSFAGKALTDAGIAGVHKDIGNQVFGATSIQAAIEDVFARLGNKFVSFISKFEVVIDLLQQIRDCVCNTDCKCESTKNTNNSLIVVPQIMNNFKSIPNTFKVIQDLLDKFIVNMKKAMQALLPNSIKTPLGIPTNTQGLEDELQQLREKLELFYSNKQILSPEDASKLRERVEKIQEELKKVEKVEPRTEKPLFDEEGLVPEFVPDEPQNKQPPNVVTPDPQSLPKQLQMKAELEATLALLEQNSILLDEALKKLPKVITDADAAILQWVDDLSNERTKLLNSAKKQLEELDQLLKNEKEMKQFQPPEQRSLPKPQEGLPPLFPPELQMAANSLSSSVQALAQLLQGATYQNVSTNLGSAATPDISGALGSAGGGTRNENTLVDNRTVSIEVKNELDADRFQQMLQQSLIQTGFSATTV